MEEGFVLISLLTFFGLILLAVLGFFTLWMLVHSLLLTITMWPRKRDNTINLLLVFMIFFLDFIGAIVYYFVRYRKSVNFKVN